MQDTEVREMVLEQTIVLEQTAEPAERPVRQKLNLEWIESEWFSVWLKLARHEHDSQ